MKVHWTPEAEQDRREVWDYIAEADIEAADRMNARFREAAERLGYLPNMGRPGIFPHTRELIPHPSYRMVYFVGEDAVHILAVMHTSRQWPPLMEDGD